MHLLFCHLGKTGLVCHERSAKVRLGNSSALTRIVGLAGRPVATVKDFYAFHPGW